jgi:hypothetical protein
MITSQPASSSATKGCTPAMATMRSVASSSSSVEVGRPSSPAMAEPARILRAQVVRVDLGIEPAELEGGEAVLRGEVADDLDVESTRLLVPVSPAEPMIIGLPVRRAASSISCRSCSCQARGLVEVSEPSGTGPTSSLPESAAM